LNLMFCVPKVKIWPSLAWIYFMASALPAAD